MRNNTVVIGALGAGVAVASYAAYRALTSDGLGFVMPTFFAALLVAVAAGVRWGATPARGASSATTGLAPWLKSRGHK